MIRIALLCVTLWVSGVMTTAANELSAVARVDPAKSSVSQDWRGNTIVQLELSQGVPFRVFTLDAPARLVIDFREVDWSGVKADDLLRDSEDVAALRFGAFQPGWSRMVADLAGPLLPYEVGMQLDENTGRAALSVKLATADQAAFEASSGVPRDALWPDTQPDTKAGPLSDARFVIVIDPGHGGIDPGAEREGLSEKVLMLDVAFELRDALMRMADVDVVLTRESDIFVSLESRVAQAHRAGADLFISLHADALSQGGAQGATVYTLSDEASDKATAHLAARHNRADIIAGADLTGSDDQVASILLDLARQETEPRSKALARALVQSMGDAGGPMNRRPLRKAGFSVLKSADIPSVLVEVGFLSSQRDLENLRNPEWRRKIVGGIARGLIDWETQDAAQRLLVRH